ncbi:hypothetical protein ACH5RR_039531 [Cinchona calisaya]|uniref:Uncharacterized protein n=1 Tax=Cinchona calisaya TaxID=153742 RepID=A0ABD2XZV4_9GENT
MGIFDDGEFCNNEHMLEDLIVDLESNGGAHIGVDNLAQQPTEAKESSQQLVRANASSQQHISHQHQRQPQQLTRRK